VLCQSLRLTRAALHKAVHYRPSRGGRATHDIGRLISPLRYDVMVRASMFQLLQGHQEVTPHLLEQILHHPYFVWFREIECARYYPRLLNDPTLLATAFEARVIRAMATMHSFDRVGFDTRHPVRLIYTRGMQIADSGAFTSSSFHIGDGCHRLALLLLKGLALEPGMYRVRSASAQLLDNTAVLLSHTHISANEYASFLARGFGLGQVKDLETLRREILMHCPQRLGEFQRVVRAQRAGYWSGEVE
jgi:hypothetical protein